MNAQTPRRLEAITDEGVFERLATAVLREYEPTFRHIAHVGINAECKTVKAPVDGIMFEPAANPPHMIAVHHTICARHDLKKKWLHDPATVKTRGTTKSTAPAGDVVKTIAIYERQKAEMPGLKATLILTTNREPPQALLREVQACGTAAGLNVIPWTLSTIAHFLDVNPDGQWLRREYLGIEQERLSHDLLRDLSKQSLELSHIAEDRALWVARALDAALARTVGRDVVFVSADPGQGKTVACYKRLAAHVDAGGFGLIVPHDAIANSPSLDQAIERTLSQLHPRLAPGCGGDALALARDSTPLLLMVEDVNRAGQAHALIERICGWSKQSNDQRHGNAWQILCPIWPRTLPQLKDETGRRLDNLILRAPEFSTQEATAAVQARFEGSGRPITLVEAEAIARSLGRDPLLIALHEPGAQTQPREVIGKFIESSVSRLAVSRDKYTAGEYRSAARALSGAMLENRVLDPTMADVSAWFARTPEVVSMVRAIAHAGEIVRVAGPPSDERLSFRHDRVRDWLLTEAAADFMRCGALPSSVLSDPFFADIIGAAISAGDAPPVLLASTQDANPLALFCAIRDFGEATNDAQRRVLAAAHAWLDTGAHRNPGNRELVWEVLRTLSEGQSSHVTPLVDRFDENSQRFWGQRARFRNGDVQAGIELCQDHEPGVGVAGHIELIEHVQKQYPALMAELAQLLRGNSLTEAGRSGALRLAGYYGQSALADDVAACFRSDLNHLERLADYLWACARCSGTDELAARLLTPVCDAWAMLPHTRDSNLQSPRDSLAAHNIRWAFRKSGLPDAAVRFFLRRAQKPELEWQITYMLHGLDHPDAIEWVVRYIAGREAAAEAAGGFVPFGMTARDVWQRRQEGDRAMSTQSRERLLSIWKDTAQSAYLRRHALQFWTSMITDGDIAILKDVPASDALADGIVAARLTRGDREAIPMLIARLKVSNSDYWWQMGRYIWSDDLSDALDQHLARRAARANPKRDFKEEVRSDWIASELVMRLPPKHAEQLLLKHWSDLRFSATFVHAALYTATPRLAEAVAAVVSECSEPKELLFKHLHMHFGIKMVDHPGVTRRAQMEGVVPYIDYLADTTISSFWECCNDHGWYDLRRQHFDPRLTFGGGQRYMTESRIVAELNQMTAAGQIYWADQWAQRILETGMSADAIADILKRWLAENKSLAALKVAASAITHFGTRRHLEVLSIRTTDSLDEAAATTANASFAIRRRKLN